MHYFNLSSSKIWFDKKLNQQKLNQRHFLLLHAFGLDHQPYLGFIDALSQIGNVYFLDLPGIGKSKIFGEFSIEIIADNIAELLENLNLSQVNLIGHSLGGYISLELLNKHPQLIQSLILLNSHPFADDDETIKLRLKQIKSIQIGYKSRFSDELLKRLFNESFIIQNEGIINDIRKILNYSSQTSIIGLIEAMKNRKDHSTTLLTSACPIAIIGGNVDNIISKEIGAKMSHLANNTYFKLIKGSSHMSIFDSRKEVLRLIHQFCDLLLDG